MVVAVDKVTEAVIIAPTPGGIETSVYSQLVFEDYRRYREEVQFKPRLAPVKYAETHYVYLNNTRRRYVSRTFYQPRVKASTFSETTFTCPKTKQELFVTYLDQNVDSQRKWFKTAVEIKARRFRSEQTIVPQPAVTDINSNQLSVVDRVTLGQDNHQQQHIPNGFSRRTDVGHNDDGGDSTANGVNERFKEKYDPGASQVYIPKRRETEAGRQALVNGGLFLDFPNGGMDLQHVGLQQNGSLLDFSDV